MSAEGVFKLIANDGKASRLPPPDWISHVRVVEYRPAANNASGRWPPIRPFGHCRRRTANQKGEH